MSDELAIDVLFVAARRLPLESVEALAQRLVAHLQIERQNSDYQLSPYACRMARFTGALTAVAEALGHPPNSTEYKREYERRKSLGDRGLPSPAAVVREFGSWAGALAAAGLIPTAPPSAFALRRARQVRVRVHRYSDQRLRECLQACARDLGRPPMVRDYIAWREHLLSLPRNTHAPGHDIPHYRTYYDHYGSWSIALADADLPSTRRARTELTTYTALRPA